MISVQRKGEIVLSVTSDGLPAAFLRMQSSTTRGRSTNGYEIGTKFRTGAR
jgi:hypothetical protein